MAKISNPDNLAIGQWYTHCCHKDLTEIEDTNDLKDVKEWLEDYLEGEAPEIEVWEGKTEALLELRDRWAKNNYPNEVKECESLILETKKPLT